MHFKLEECNCLRLFTCRKLFLIMKFIILMLILSLSHVSARVLSQTITFQGNQVTIEKILKEVERQSGFDIFYRYDEDLMGKRVDVRVREVHIKTFLDEILTKNGLSYQIENKTIVINRNPKIIDNASEEISLQSDKLRGVILDNQTGEPLVGATVRIKGTTIGTMADVDGVFNLENVQDGS